MSYTVLRINSPILVGIEGRWVSSAVHVNPPSPPQLHTVVHRALHAAGFGDDRHFVADVVADAARRDSSTNLAMALALLAAEGRVPRDALQNVLPLGVLTDDGHIKPLHGTYAILRTLPLGRSRTILVPRAAAVHASWVAGLTLLTADSLAGAVRVLCSPPPSTATPPLSVHIPSIPVEALSEPWRITSTTAHALDVAAAGGHHVLLVGPEGSATTWLARRFVYLLPPPTLDEALEITAHHASANTPTPRAILTARPVMAPPPSISASGLAGGGEPFVPGELTLAHHGVLVLEDLPRFAASTLTLAARALRERQVRFNWQGERPSVPTNPHVIATMTACPCGRLGDPHRHCACTPTQVMHHHARIPKVFRSIFAMMLPIPIPSRHDQIERAPDIESRREAIAVARQRGSARDPKHDPSNRLTSGASGYIQSLLTEGVLSTTMRTHLVDVAATIARLQGQNRITDTDIRLARDFVALQADE